MLEGGLGARPIRSGLENLLPFYGVKVDENLVLDRQCAVAGFRSGYFQYMVPYPYWPRINKENLSKENPVVSRLETILMPWVSAVSESEMKPEGVQFIKLAWSSPQSWVLTGPYNLNPQPITLPEATTMKSYTVAAALTGKFKSYYADKEIPPAAPDTVAMAIPQAEPPKLAESPETQIFVCGSSQVVNNNFLGQFPANMTFLLNAIDWVALGNDLIAIRSRSVSDRPIDPEMLKDEAEGKRNTIKFAGIFGMPILLTLFGMVRWLSHRREKKAFVTSLQGEG
jgi:ABC-2 type transport system permease protein